MSLIIKNVLLNFSKKNKQSVFLLRAKPMRYYNKIFDIFLFEGIYIFLFSLLLLLLNDRYTDIFFKVSITSIIIAGVLWVIGYSFNLFIKEDNFEES